MIHASKKYNEGHIKTIPEDEPVFLLRAQDRSAVATVLYWLSLQPVNSPLREEVTRHAILMEQWPIKKLPGCQYDPTPACKTNRADRRADRA